MKIIIPIVLALVVSICNIPWVYGFRGGFSKNPFIFAACFNLLCGTTLLAISLVYGRIEDRYLTHNWKPVVFAAVGMVFVSLLMYLIVNRYGASYYIIASLFNVVVPGLVVGFLILKEKCNVVWIIPSLFCAVLSVLFFWMSKR